MSLSKRLNSFRFAFQGLFDLFKSQPNARIHLITMTLVVPTGFYVHLSNLEWSLVVMCIALVLSMEAVNTALEYLTDLVSPDHHPLAGKAKDVAAAAVLIAAIGAAVVGAILFIPKLSALFHA
jgi:diacylglycerol kinase